MNNIFEEIMQTDYGKIIAKTTQRDCQETENKIIKLLGAKFSSLSPKKKIRECFLLYLKILNESTTLRELLQNIDVLEGISALASNIAVSYAEDEEAGNLDVSDVHPYQYESPEFWNQSDDTIMSVHLADVHVILNRIPFVSYRMIVELISNIDAFLYYMHKEQP